MEENPDDELPEKVEGKEEPKGPPPVPEKGEPGGEVGVHEVIWANAKLFSRRIVRSNFLSDGVSEEEKEALEEAGVSSPMSQNYLAWRRALLWFGAGALGIAIVLGLFSRFEGMGQFPGIFQLVWVLVFLAELGACTLIVFAAMKWTEIALTRQLARMSWFCLFLVPIVLFMIPIVPFMDGGFGFNAMQAKATFGLMYLIILAPKLVGVFPAVIRSSLALKSLLPESPMPGWIAVIVAPLYALFFIMLTVIAIQVNDFVLVLSMAALATAPMLIVMNVNRLVKPCSEEEAVDNIRHVRKRIGIANLIGIAAGVIYGFQIIKTFSFLDTLQFFGAIFASVLLLTVVAADLLIGVFRTAFLRENALREKGELATSLGARFDDLQSRGLTELRAGEEHMLGLLVGKGFNTEKKAEGDDAPPKDPPASPPPAE